MKYERSIPVMLSLLIAGPLLADAGHGVAADHPPLRNLLGEFEVNVARGRTLFVEKGCVACHAINGVGGHDAAPAALRGFSRGRTPARS